MREDTVLHGMGEPSLVFRPDPVAKFRFAVMVLVVLSRAPELLACPSGLFDHVPYCCRLGITPVIPVYLSVTFCTG